MDSRYYSLDPYLEDPAEAVLTGTLDHTDTKSNSLYLFLKDVSVQPGCGTKQFYFSDFLLISQSGGQSGQTTNSFGQTANHPSSQTTNLSGQTTNPSSQTIDLSIQNKVWPDRAVHHQIADESGGTADSFNETGKSGMFVSGSLLKASGRIYPFVSPSNPGQFDEKAYYKEKNIFYKMSAKNISLVKDEANLLKQSLYNFRASLTGVYQICMPGEKAGTVSAMLLGEKSLLDADIKSLYQANGIGHILAISGLHISIICTILYRLLLFLRLPRPLPFLVSLLFLMGYGEMTGFGISTSRAVVMMLMALFAREIGRSYDPPTAMAASAVILLLQKPYAVFSCSFLLSYSAVLGVYLTYPALQGIFFGNHARQVAGRQRKRRRQREMMANIRPAVLVPLLERVLFPALENLKSGLLFSLAVQITTLPIILYFFYEVPLYGILLNLFVIPLVSAIVVLSMLGGIIGLFCLPAAKLLLLAVTAILSFYDHLCQLFLLLPGAVQILGRPSLYQIIIYYFMLAVVLFAGNRILHQREGKDAVRFPLILCILLGLLFLLYRRPVSGLQFIMLDVGQGDGLLLRSDTGKTILIDGGSSSVAKVGEYRIIPCLKYYGIRKIDYMIMTHADEDHISGQLEIMESTGKRHTGLAVGCFLMPQLAGESMDDNYCKMQETALKSDIPVQFFNTGDSLVTGGLNLLCLHPDRDFANVSANACSVTLSVSYGKFRMLLTGDLEKEGEDVVEERLKEDSGHYYEWSLPKSYTVLKVAHHGSKNSTDETFLSTVQPEISLISCGKRNRYGHPHADLLQRLENVGSKICQTAECGAIQVETDGKSVWVQEFLSRAQSVLKVPVHRHLA